MSLPSQKNPLLLSPALGRLVLSFGQKNNQVSWPGWFVFDGESLSFRDAGMAPETVPAAFGMDVALPFPWLPGCHAGDGELNGTER